jgi:hypothetical protein
LKCFLGRAESSEGLSQPVGITRPRARRAEASGTEGTSPVILPANYFSKAKIFCQSFFMLITFHCFAFAPAIKLSLKVSMCGLAP